MPTLSTPELLARLVAFDSTSHRSNRPIADFIADYLDRPGVRIERQPSPQGDDKVNLIVELGPATDAATRDGLILSGHMDVVPAEEPEWRSDPFTLTDAGDAWAGRGSADMKGFVALAMQMAATVDPATLRRPLVLVLTYDEEIGTVGARDFARAWPEAWPLPRRAIIGEPTSLAVVRLHKGHAKLQVTVRGRSAHSGYPHLGHNAIEPAARLVAALSELRRELERESPPHREHFPEVPFVALNVARIAGGTAINIVPDACTVDVGFRVLPGMEAEEVASRLRAAIAAAVPGESIEIGPLSESPPMLLGEGSDLYRDLCRTMGQTATVSASYATDAGWLQTRGIDCLLWGPGTIEVAHRPNESIPKAELERAETLLRGVVHRFAVDFSVAAP